MEILEASRLGNNGKSFLSMRGWLLKTQNSLNWLVEEDRSCTFLTKVGTRFLLWRQVVRVKNLSLGLRMLVYQYVNQIRSLCMARIQQIMPFQFFASNLSICGDFLSFQSCTIFLGIIQHIWIVIQCEIKSKHIFIIFISFIWFNLI